MRLARMTTLRSMLATVSVAVLVFAIIAALGSILSTWTGVVAFSAAVGGLFALGAMRLPWISLVIAFALYIGLPKGSGSSPSFFENCCLLGWLWGAIAGLIVRIISKRNRAKHHRN